MKKISNLLLLTCLLLLAVGLSDVGGAIFSGLARALGAVLFILAFVTRVLEKAEVEARAEIRH